MGRDTEPTVFELSSPGRHAFSFRTTGLPEWDSAELIPDEWRRDEPLDVAEVSERDLVAHVTRLSARQYSVDLGAYPLGSCTMKYNPKLCDEAAALPGLTRTHPATPPAYAQGWLELLWSLADSLCAVTGMHAATLQPPAGAAGELTGLLLMRAWHAAQGRERTKGHHPRFGARHQPGVGDPRRLPDRHRALGSPRSGRPRRAAGTAGRRRGRHHAHQPQHARPV